MKPKRVLIRNVSGVELHGIPAGAEHNARATEDGKLPERLEFRKRLNDGAFAFVDDDKPAKKSKGSGQ